MSSFKWDDSYVSQDCNEDEVHWHPHGGGVSPMAALTVTAACARASRHHSKPRAPLQHVLVPAERHSKPRAPLQHALVLAERHSKPRAPRTLQGTQPATSLSSKTRKSLNTYTRCKKSLERLLCTYANRSETKWNRQFHRKEQNLPNRYRNLMQANFHRGSKES